MSKAVRFLVEEPRALRGRSSGARIEREGKLGVERIEHLGRRRPVTTVAVIATVVPRLHPSDDGKTIGGIDCSSHPNLAKIRSRRPVRVEERIKQRSKREIAVAHESTNDFAARTIDR